LYSFVDRGSNSQQLITLTSTDCSDNAPLLLQLCAVPWAKLRFHFEAFWVKLDGFEHVVKQAWDCNVVAVDACRVVDFKLRKTAKALQSWRMQNIGSVRSQLFMARELIAQLDVAQESRMLSDEELSLRKGLKLQSLGLASVARTIAHQRSRIRFLEEGDANTKFFHLYACHKNRKNHIPSIQHDGAWFSADEAMSNLIFEYFNGILGKPLQRLHSIKLQDLLPQLDMSGLDACFT
jgi:hypothetical protein